jgi:hypothetical protein
MTLSEIKSRKPITARKPKKSKKTIKPITIIDTKADND